MSSSFRYILSGCPMSFEPAEKHQVRYGTCKTKECAWWVPRGHFHGVTPPAEGDCAIVALAEGVRGIAEALKETPRA